jgi:hypothetical protein
MPPPPRRAASRRWRATTARDGDLGRGLPHASPRRRIRLEGPRSNPAGSHAAVIVRSAALPPVPLWAVAHGHHGGELRPEVNTRPTGRWATDGLAARRATRSVAHHPEADRPSWLCIRHIDTSRPVPVPVRLRGDRSPTSTGPGGARGRRRARRRAASSRDPRPRRSEGPRHRAGSERDSACRPRGRHRGSTAPRRRDAREGSWKRLRRASPSREAHAWAVRELSWGSVADRYDGPCTRGWSAGRSVPSPVTATAQRPLVGALERRDDRVRRHRPRRGASPRSRGDPQAGDPDAWPDGQRRLRHLARAARHRPHRYPNPRTVSMSPPASPSLRRR